MNFHPFAEIFPLIEGDDFDALVDDIKTHGLREKIVCYRGKILDGRNRFLACKRAGVDPDFRKFDGDEDDALAFVISSNVQRRHLTIEQRAIAAAKAANLGKGRPKNAARAAFTQEQASEKFDVSRDSIQRAKKVVEHGSKALQRAVESGEVPLKKAASVVELPKSEQLEAATAKPAPKPEPENDLLRDDWKPADDEDEALARAEAEYAASIDRVMQADEKLAASNTEIKRLTEEVASLKFARDSYMNGKASVTHSLKQKTRECDRLRRDLEKARSELESLRERIAIMESAA